MNQKITIEILNDPEQIVVKEFEKTTITIGCSDSDDLKFDISDAIMPSHASIRLEGEQFILTNNCFSAVSVNGISITSVVIGDDDIIQFGTLGPKLRFKVSFKDDATISELLNLPDKDKDSKPQELQDKETVIADISGKAIVSDTKTPKDTPRLPLKKEPQPTGRYLSRQAKKAKKAAIKKVKDTKNTELTFLENIYTSHLEQKLTVFVEKVDKFFKGKFQNTPDKYEEIETLIKNYSRPEKQDKPEEDSIEKITAAEPVLTLEERLEFRSSFRTHVAIGSVISIALSSLDFFKTCCSLGFIMPLVMASSMVSLMNIRKGKIEKRTYHSVLMAAMIVLIHNVVIGMWILIDSKEPSFMGSLVLMLFFVIPGWLIQTLIAVYLASKIANSVSNKERS